MANNMNLQKQKQVEASMHGGYHDDNGPIVLDMSNFVGILLLWTLGIVLAILTFFIELAIHHHQREGKGEEEGKGEMEMEGV